MCVKSLSNIPRAGTSLRELVHTFRQRTLVLVKALMLQKRVCPPSHRLLFPNSSSGHTDHVLRIPSRASMHLPILPRLPPPGAATNTRRQRLAPTCFSCAYVVQALVVTDIGSEEYDGVYGSSFGYLWEGEVFVVLSVGSDDDGE